MNLVVFSRVGLVVSLGLGWSFLWSESGLEVGYFSGVKLSVSLG